MGERLLLLTTYTTPGALHSHSLHLLIGYCDARGLLFVTSQLEDTF